jgi:antitoxin component of MazEF toxin-antitoxin module
MNAKIQAWGNSQGLRLAKPLLEAAHLAVGEEVEVLAKDGQITIRPSLKPKPKVRIQDLVARMPKGYKPREEGFGPAAGKEAW